MRDHFDFEAPFGILGEIVSKIILFNHMKQLLEERNKLIKKVAETDKWEKLLI